MPSAEDGEGRAQTEENIVQSHMRPTQSGKRMSQGLHGVRPAPRFRRHSSTVRAVCVNAPVRICAGGDQRWSSLPRQLSSDTTYPVVLCEVGTKLRWDQDTAELLPSRPETSGRA